MEEKEAEDKEAKDKEAKDKEATVEPPASDASGASSETRPVNPSDAPTAPAPTALARPDEPDRRPLILLAIFGGIVVVVAMVGYFLLTNRAPGGTGLIEAELQDRGRIAVLGDDDLTHLRAEGAQLIAASDIPGLVEAFQGDDEDRLADLLADEGIGAVLVDGRSPPADLGEDASLGERLRGYGNVEALRGVYLAPTAALYERRRGLRLSIEDGAIAARAARQIVGGGRLPRIRAFPESIRRTRHVEVMVMLEQGGRARLWRSARSGSIARALITASSVARQRWMERQQVMGGSIDDVLPRLTVRVFLLEEDGTLAERDAAFIERVFTLEHGVAFEHRRSWHYLLPNATQERGAGSFVAAYVELFGDSGLPDDSLDRPNIRLYRLVARELGSSAPTSALLPPPRPSVDLDGFDPMVEPSGGGDSTAFPVSDSTRADAPALGAASPEPVDELIGSERLGGTAPGSETAANER